MSLTGLTPTMPSNRVDSFYEFRGDINFRDEESCWKSLRNFAKYEDSDISGLRQQVLHYIVTNIKAGLVSTDQLTNNCDLEPLIANVAEALQSDLEYKEARNLVHCLADACVRSLSGENRKASDSHIEQHTLAVDHSLAQEHEFASFELIVKYSGPNGNEEASILLQWCMRGVAKGLPLVNFNLFTSTVLEELGLSHEPCSNIKFTYDSLESLSKRLVQSDRSLQAAVIHARHKDKQTLNLDLKLSSSSAEKRDASTIQSLETHDNSKKLKSNERQYPENLAEKSASSIKSIPHLQALKTPISVSTLEAAQTRRPDAAESRKSLALPERSPAQHGRTESSGHLRNLDLGQEESATESISSSETAKLDRSFLDHLPQPLNQSVSDNEAAAATLTSLTPIWYTKAETHDKDGGSDLAASSLPPQSPHDVFTAGTGSKDAPLEIQDEPEVHNWVRSYGHPNRGIDYKILEEQFEEGMAIESIEGDDMQDDEDQEEDEVAREREHKIAALLQNSMVTEHLSYADFKDMCEVLGHDDSLKHNKFTSKQEGMKDLYAQQKKAAWTITKYLAFQGGFWAADEVGLGKTAQALMVMTIRSLIGQNLLHIREHPEEHLLDKDQDDASRCPAQDKQGILCLCLKRNPLHHIDIRTGATLILSPASLIGNWVNEIEKRMDWNNKFVAWAGAIHYPPSPSICSKHIRQATDDDLDDLTCPVRTLSLRNIMSIDGADVRSAVESTKKFVLASKYGIDGFVNRFEEPLRPGLLIMDEAHKHTGPKTQLGDLCKKLGRRGTRFVYITGTPISKSPDKLVDLVVAFSQKLEDRYRADGGKKDPWNERRNHRERILSGRASKLGIEHITQLGRWHRSFVENGSHKDLKFSKYIRLLQEFVGFLFIRRTKRGNLFFGNPMVESMPILKVTIGLELRETQAKVIRDLFEQGRIECDKIFEQRQVNQKSRPRSIAETAWPVETFLKKQAKGKTLTTYPQLRLIEATKYRAFTLDEDRKDGLMKRHKDVFYAYRADSNLYAQYIKSLTKSLRAPKYNWLVNEVKSWPKEDKGFIVCSSPTEATNTFFALIFDLNEAVAIVDSIISKNKVNDIIELFNESATTRQKYSDVRFPRILIATADMCSEGHNLQKANRVVQMGPTWVPSVEDQILGRVDRIGQNKQIFFIQLVCTNSSTDMIMRKKVKRRAEILEVGLKAMKQGEDELDREEEEEASEDVGSDDEDEIY